MPLMEAESRPIVSNTRRHPRHIRAGVQTQFAALSSLPPPRTRNKTKQEEAHIQVRKRGVEMIFDLGIFSPQISCFHVEPRPLCRIPLLTIPQKFCRVRHFRRGIVKTSLHLKRAQFRKYPDNTPSHQRRRATNPLSVSHSR